MELSFADVVTDRFSPSTLYVYVEISIKFKKKYRFRNNFDRLGFQQYSDYTSIYTIQIFVRIQIHK
jgi:hypothetical protein